MRELVTEPTENLKLKFSELMMLCALCDEAGEKLAGSRPHVALSQKAHRALLRVGKKLGKTWQQQRTQTAARRSKAASAGK